MVATSVQELLANGANLHQAASEYNPNNTPHTKKFSILYYANERLSEMEEMARGMPIAEYYVNHVFEPLIVMGANVNNISILENIVNSLMVTQRDDYKNYLYKLLTATLRYPGTIVLDARTKSKMIDIIHASDNADLMQAFKSAKFNKRSET